MKNYTTVIENDAGKTNPATGKPDTYFKLKKADMIQACRDLSERELKVWLCLISNTDNYSCEYMRKQVEDELGDSKRFGNEVICRAIKGLKEKGYIQESDGIEVVRTYGGECPDNYVPVKKPGRNNRVAKIATPEEPVLTNYQEGTDKSSDKVLTNCQIDTDKSSDKVLTNCQIDTDKSSDTTGQIVSTNRTIEQYKTINSTTIPYHYDYAAKEKYDYFYDDYSDVDTSDMPF